MIVLAEIALAFTLFTSPVYKERKLGEHKLRLSGATWELLLEINAALPKSMPEEKYWFRKVAWEKFVEEKEYIYLEWNGDLNEDKMKDSFQFEVEFYIKERRRNGNNDPNI